MGDRKSAVGFALVALLVSGTMFGAASLGRAGSVRTSAAIKVSPHVLTAGEDGFFTIGFSNAGPSTVNHAFATVTALFTDENGTVTGGPLPLPASAFSGFDLPAGCNAVPDPEDANSSTLTCDIGHVPPSTVRRVISFTAPTTVTPFNAHVSVTFDERKGTALTDTVVGDDVFPFSIASGTTTKGQCTPAGSTLTAGDTLQQTSLTYLALSLTLFPCTPASAGVDAVMKPVNVAKPFGEISFVEFLGGAGLGTVKVYFFTTPPGVTKKNLALYELARFPISLVATGVNGVAQAVPPCDVVGGEPQIPSTTAGFISCVIGVNGIPGGGLLATLLSEGGDDGGWGGIG